MRFLKDFIVKFFFLLNLLAALFALLVFQVSYAADIKHWLGGFLTLCVPIAFLINIFFMLSYIFSGSWKFILSLLVLVAGYALLERTIKFNLTESGHISTNKISILSYNAMYCAYGSIKSEDGRTSAINLVNDIDTLKADIKCFQELYNQPGHPIFNVIERLKDDNPYFTYMHSEIEEDSHIGGVGLSIFSKYPIIHKEEVSWKINNNGILIADIVVKRDTIRVFNIQMKSMGIRVKKAITSDEVVRNKEARNILSQLKTGFEDRGVQVDELERMINDSPYPVLLAGDFNELPYGYAYGRVRKTLSNAFEEAGFGFGFTYHKLPSFLRIDNLFFDEAKFDIMNFETYRELKNSDHYPIYAAFSIN